MKFTVEVEEFYLEEGELSSALTSQIKAQVVNQIEKSIKDRVEKQIAMEVKAQVEAAMYQLIQAYTKETINTGKVPSRKNKGEQVTLAEYIVEMFNAQFATYTDPTEMVKKIASGCVEEIKKRYDMLFASQIVTKMKEVGLLNEEAAKALLTKS